LPKKQAKNPPKGARNEGNKNICTYNNPVDLADQPGKTPLAARTDAGKAPQMVYRSDPFTPWRPNGIG
jgi:hypothetical protein